MRLGALLLLILFSSALAQPVGKARGSATYLFFDADKSVDMRRAGKNARPDRRVEMKFQSALAVWRPRVLFLDIYVFPRKVKPDEVPALLEKLKETPKFGRSTLAFTQVGFQYHVKKYKTGKLSEASPKFSLTVNDGKGDGYQEGRAVQGDKRSTLTGFSFKPKGKADAQGRIGRVSLRLKLKVDIAPQDRRLDLQLRQIPVYELKLPSAYE